jgi:two-component system sensor histidine kinase KdpD
MTPKGDFRPDPRRPDPRRPDPDELLRQVQAQEQLESRGRLKIFLGYAPRVGKSLRMFEEGLRRKKRGQDVVVGMIQTRGADELEGVIRQMEVIPPMLLGGVATLDLNAILDRAPHVCLVDELARENPVGSRNPHRWQDVEALRSAGINVVTAVNLQYVRDEHVPPAFIHSADELVIVDTPTDSSAPQNELREEALLLAAQVVEEQLQRYMDAHGIHQSWGTQERILVCITPRSSARAMLESAALATERFHGQMLAVYVQQGELPRELQEALDANLGFARELGAEVKVLEHRDAIGAIVEFAQKERITQLYIGHTHRRPWKFWQSSPVDQLIEAAEGIDVRLFPRAQTA